VNTHPDADDPTHADRRETYYGLLRTIKVNTGSPDGPNDQPAAMHRGALLANRTDAGVPVDAVESALTAARENGHVFAYRDRDGDVRVCLTTEHAIRALVAEENQRADADTELISTAAEYLE